MYNEADNIVNYPAASLHAAILAQHAKTAAARPTGTPSSSAADEAKAAMGDTAVVEVTIRYAQGWAMHDFPLSLDLDAWYAMIAAERAALGIGKDGRALRGSLRESDLQRSPEPAAGGGGGGSPATPGFSSHSSFV